MGIFFPKTLTKLIKIFRDNNFECYVVGGAVRDIIMGIIPNEFDICTNALTTDIKHIFKIFRDEQTHLGCIKIFFEDTWFEVTTFRVESDYKNFRHPEFVKFIDSYKIDAMRRDFTINSIYSNGVSLLDPLNGIEDINKKLLRLIGNKHSKFYEDPLRILRCLNFKSKFNFKIEFSTLISLKNNFHMIKYLSKYRLHSELNKIFENRYSHKCIKFFQLLNGFQIIFHRDFKIYNFNTALTLSNKFHIKLFCMLYFHSNVEKTIIPDLLKDKLNFNRSELREIKSIFKILYINNFNNSNVFIKNLIFNYGYDLSFTVLNILNVYYGPSFKNILRKFFKIKWSYEPIKISHLNITLGKFLENKKNITKYNKYLVTILHINPKLNRKRILLHLIKTKFKL